MRYEQHEQHEQHECDTSVTWAVRVRYKRHECNTSDTRRRWVRHQCYVNNTRTTRLKSFDFDNDMIGNIFPHPYTCYMASERLQGKEQFYSKNYLLGMPYSPWLNAFEKCTTKTEVCNGKGYIKKSYTNTRL